MYRKLFRLITLIFTYTLSANGFEGNLISLVHSDCFALQTGADALCARQLSERLAQIAIKKDSVKCTYDILTVLLGIGTIKILEDPYALSSINTTYFSALLAGSIGLGYFLYTREQALNHVQKQLQEIFTSNQLFRRRETAHKHSGCVSKKTLRTTL